MNQADGEQEPMASTTQTDENTTALAEVIGARVRKERLARKWTLDDLATVAGVSRRMLVNVEKGTVNPSVGTLLKISDALGVGLPALVEPPQSRHISITRDGRGAPLWTSERGGRGVLVAGTDPPDVVELWDWVLAPGDRHVSEPHSRGTRELMQMQEGTLNVTIGEQQVTLKQGDALSFPGDQDHAYANHGMAPARFTLAVFEPGVGSNSRLENTSLSQSRGNQP